jgi:ribosomal protein S18 acetylase RimI-like enzyme
MLIRPYGDHDLAAMLGIIKAAFKEHEGKVVPPPSAAHKTLEILKAELQKADAFVAELPELVGCVIYEIKGNALYLGRLAVLPAYRKRGIGTALIGAVEAKARALKLDELQLSVRFPLYEQQALYQSLGFEVVSLGTHPGFAEPTFLKMAKRLETDTD